MLNIVLFGPPGAGKGTQSQKLIDKYSLLHLSTGDMLRQEIGAGTDLGLKAKTLMDAGQLVPDDVVIGMIANKLDNNATAAGFVFDGFPRTVPQAEALDSLLNSRNAPINIMVALEVDEQTLVKRLLLRGQTSGREDDRNETLINHRVKEYNTKTAPVAHFYQGQNKYSGVYGIGDIDTIFENIVKSIEAIKA